MRNVHPILLLLIVLLLCWFPTIIGLYTVEEGWRLTKIVFMGSVVVYFICEQKIISNALASDITKFPNKLFYFIIFLFSYVWLPVLFIETYSVTDAGLSNIVMFTVLGLIYFICGRQDQRK